MLRNSWEIHIIGDKLMFCNDSIDVVSKFHKLFNLGTNSTIVYKVPLRPNSIIKGDIFQLAYLVFVAES